MTQSTQAAQALSVTTGDAETVTLLDRIDQFLRFSEGAWRSERRYYTLPDGKVQEIVSHLTVQFLEQDSPELVQLTQLHQLEDTLQLLCGSKVTWSSTNSETGKLQSEGSTVFGVRGTLLYRDRGFATSKPVVAQYSMADSDTMSLRTEYNDSVFEEEIKHIGQRYRTRQSIISRAGEQLMIGQYLEKRID
ncbi:MAG: phycobiliprotein lyase [Microcoleaceae cyanobacterium]